jgi:hypothetical protein
MCLLHGKNAYTGWVVGLIRTEYICAYIHTYNGIYMCIHTYIHTCIHTSQNSLRRARAPLGRKWQCRGQAAPQNRDLCSRLDMC